MEWLLGEPDGTLDLYPAEAGMLVLLPYLYYPYQGRGDAPPHMPHPQHPARRKRLR